MRKVGDHFRPWCLRGAIILAALAGGRDSAIAQTGGLNGTPGAAASRTSPPSAADRSVPGAPASPAAAGGAAGTGLPTGMETQTGGDILKTLTGSDPTRLAVPLRILGLLTVLTLVPSIILLTTCFPRIVIVLSFVRRAIGTQELPPNQVIIGLALFLTAMIMAPVWEEIHGSAIAPYQEGRIGEEEAVRRALLPLKKFMIDRTLRTDLRLFVELSKYEETAQRKGISAGEEPLTDLPITVVVPSFILSELKTAFQMGFVLYLPFVVIDLIISTALISMGMLVLPPILISMPLKVLVFVLVDGWRLIVQELVRSFV